MPHDLTQDALILREAAKEAAAIALKYWGREVEAHRKPDGSPVTEADLAVDAHLIERLRNARPNYGWLSEESADHEDRLACERVWVVDPIDGTRAFISGAEDWTVALALVEHGQPLLSVVVNPVRGQFFEARKGHGAVLNGRPIAPSTNAELEGARIAASDGVLRKQIWPRPWPKLSPVWVNSLAYRLALVASGELDAAFALYAKSEWDVAAGALLVTEAGATASTPDGSALVFNTNEAKVNGFVAAPPMLHQKLINQLEGVLGTIGELRTF